MIKFAEALSRGVEENGLSIDTKDRKKANYGCKSRWKLVCSEARPYEPPFNLAPYKMHGETPVFSLANRKRNFSSDYCGQRRAGLRIEN